MRNASAAKKEGNGIKKRKSKQERRFFLLGLLFVSPWLIGFLCFQLYPILSALYYSFTDFNIFQPAEFTGLDNYVTLFNDKYFPVSIKNTAVMSFIGMPIGLVVALALAVLLSKEVKGMPAFRTIYYLPTVVPIVASAMLFLWVLNPEYGLLNNFLSWFGIRGPSWLSDPKFTKISLMIMDVWRCGQNTVIFQKYHAFAGSFSHQLHVFFFTLRFFRSQCSIKLCHFKKSSCLFFSVLDIF